MSDLLFVELGAVVTQVLGPTWCTFEPFCSPQEPPTYDPENRVEADFVKTVDNLIGDGLGAQAQYDQYIGPTDAGGNVNGSAPLGPSWPGAPYEGVVRILKNLVDGNTKLRDAVGLLPGQPWEHYVVASIDDQAKTVQRYHGYYAQVVGHEGQALRLKVAHAGASTEPPRWAPQEVLYDPADTVKFYSGPLVASWILRAGAAVGSVGAVFVSASVAWGDYGIEDPKLPPGAGL